VRAWLARRLAARPSEAGISLVEVVVAVTILAVGLFATIESLVRASEASLQAQRHEQALSTAQREIERLRLTPYANLRLTSNPGPQPSGLTTGETNPRNPDYYVVAGTPSNRFLIKSNYHDATSPPLAGVDPNGEELVTGDSATGTVVHYSTFTSGATEGNIYRYVTYRDERCGATTDTCPGTADSKRLTVAVVLDASPNGTGPDRPVYLSTVVTEPEQ
jgi:type II secretory pathway pseudopilin PulG